MAVVTVGVLREMPRKFVQNLKPNSKEPKKTTLMQRGANEHIAEVRHFLG